MKIVDLLAVGGAHGRREKICRTIPHQNETHREGRGKTP
jgi:hypothetical protein